MWWTLDPTMAHSAVVHNNSVNSRDALVAHLRRPSEVGKMIPLWKCDIIQVIFAWD